MSLYRYISIYAQMDPSAMKFIHRPIKIAFPSFWWIAWSTTSSTIALLPQLHSSLLTLTNNDHAKNVSKVWKNTEKVIGHVGHEPSCQWTTLATKQFEILARWKFIPQTSQKTHNDPSENTTWIVFPWNSFSTSNLFFFVSIVGKAQRSTCYRATI